MPASMLHTHKEQTRQRQYDNFDKPACTAAIAIMHHVHHHHPFFHSSRTRKKQKSRITSLSSLTLSFLHYSSFEKKRTTRPWQKGPHVWGDEGRKEGKEGYADIGRSL